jgi:hypothetical protein
MIIQAPHKLPETAIVLPNPAIGNEEKLQIELVLGDAEDSTQYSYIKRTPNKSLVYDFSLGRPKAKELKNFLLLYYTQEMRIIDHEDVTWKVFLMNDLAELTKIAGEEFVEVRLMFEGVKL